MPASDTPTETPELNDAAIPVGRRIVVDADEFEVALLTSVAPKIMSDNAVSGDEWVSLLDSLGETRSYQCLTQVLMNRSLSIAKVGSDYILMPVTDPALLAEEWKILLKDDLTSSAPCPVA